jgi:DsbC/DsbD-like thiol-disulfide interchange protein
VRTLRFPLLNALPCPRVLPATHALFGMVFASALSSTSVHAAESARVVVVKDERGQAVVTAVLESESSALMRDESFRLGTRLTMADGWHVYWTNPGDAGMATKLTFSSTDVATGTHHFPAPEVFASSAGEVVSFGYGRELTIVTEADVLSVDAETVRVDAKLSLLACKDICIPGKATMTLTLPLVDDTRARASKGVRAAPRTRKTSSSARASTTSKRGCRARSRARLRRKGRRRAHDSC